MPRNQSLIPHPPYSRTARILSRTSTLSMSSFGMRRVPTVFMRIPCSVTVTSILRNRASMSTTTTTAVTTQMPTGSIPRPRSMAPR